MSSWPWPWPAREAVCPACATHGRLDLAGEETGRLRAEVRCRNGRHAWSMADYGDE